jgi:hypothetical protein
MKIKACLVLVFIILFLVTTNSQNITGNIEGHIVDSTGGENKFIVDGVDVDDPEGYPAAIRLPYNFINEIDVKTGRFNLKSYHKNI